MALSSGVAIVATALILAPLIVWHYGGSSFTTWAGPYPMSYSGTYFWYTHAAGKTVSYRHVLEAYFYLPGTAFQRIADWIPLPRMPLTLFLLLLGSVGYAALLSAGVLIASEAGCVLGCSRRHNRSSSRHLKCLSRELVVLPAVLLALSWVLALESLGAHWDGLPPWVYLSLAALCLPLAAISVNEARTVRKAGLTPDAPPGPALVIRGVLTTLMSAGAMLLVILLLRARFRTAYPGDIATVALFLTLLSASAVLIVWYVGARRHIDRRQTTEGR